MTGPLQNSQFDRFKIGHEEIMATLANLGFVRGGDPGEGFKTSSPMLLVYPDEIAKCQAGQRKRLLNPARVVRMEGHKSFIRTCGSWHVEIGEGGSVNFFACNPGEEPKQVGRRTFHDRSKMYIIPDPELLFTGDARNFDRHFPLHKIALDVLNDLVLPPRPIDFDKLK